MTISIYKDNKVVKSYFNENYKISELKEKIEKDLKLEDSFDLFFFGSLLKDDTIMDSYFNHQSEIPLTLVIRDKNFKAPINYDLNKIKNYGIITLFLLFMFRS